MGHETTRGPGRPPRPFTPFEQADIDMAGKLRRWEGQLGARNCALAAFELSKALAFQYLSTLNDPAFMGFRNAFRSYCNLWRNRHLSENWEVPSEDMGADSLPTTDSHNAAFAALGIAGMDEMVKKFVDGATYSFVMPGRKSPSGKPIPVRVVLGTGPGDDPRGYGRKPLPVRYADAVTQQDRNACMLVDTILSGQMVATRMDRWGEDVTVAGMRHELLVLFHVYCQLLGVTGFDWTGWCWHPDFLFVAPELEALRRPDSACGRFSSSQATYSLLAFLRLRREAGGATGFQSLLYCEDSDECDNHLFFWDGTAPGLRKKGKPTKVPHLCPNHDPDQVAAWRKRRERARKRAERESRKT